MYDLIPAVQLIGRVVASPVGDTYVINDIRVDPEYGLCEFEIERATHEGGADDDLAVVDTLEDWVLVPKDITPEEVIAGAAEPARHVEAALGVRAEAEAEGTPFTPENIACIGGRFFHDGIDVTERPVAWLCIAGHEWWATLAHRTSGRDEGCPQCGTRAPRRAPQGKNKKRRRKR